VAAPTLLLFPGETFAVFVVVVSSGMLVAIIGNKQMR
jgi:hypothetical protein